jgi:hypothetical protein
MAAGVEVQIEFDVESSLVSAKIDRVPVATAMQDLDNWPVSRTASDWWYCVRSVVTPEALLNAVQYWYSLESNYFDPCTLGINSNSYHHVTGALNAFH